MGGRLRPESVAGINRNRWPASSGIGGRNRAEYAISGYFINSTIKKNEIKVKYVQIAVSILKDKPRDDTRALRNWAIDIIRKNAIIELSEDAAEELRKYPLPSDIYLRDTAGNIITDESGDPITTP